MTTKMTLTEYLTGRTADDRASNFHAYDAFLPNGGKIVAHHNRDDSTAKYFAEMMKDQYLVTYNLPDGTSCRLQICDGGVWVTVKNAK